MRTITQRTTLPFLIADSGDASFTAAVTTSPSPARSPRSPPRGRMHESLRAPLLSAPSRIVLLPIMLISSLMPGYTRLQPRFEPPKPTRLKPRLPVDTALDFYVQIG